LRRLPPSPLEPPTRNCLLDQIGAGQRPEQLVPKQRDAYRAASEEMPDDSWKTM
jgi:hypothetical protein